MKNKIVLTLICFALLVNAVNAVDIVMNVTNLSHPFNGFGAQVWPGDMRVENLFSQLNLKYFRIAPGGCPEPPTDATVEQMDSYVNSQYSGTGRGNNVISSLEIAESQDIKVIFVKFGGPDVYLNDSNELLSQYTDDYARLWASEVYFFKSRGYKVDYVELFNEPEGHWNIYCPPSKYNTVVKLVRAELDSRGLTDVGIIGPGLAYLFYGTSWISSLDTQGKAALAAWSTHAWDESTSALPSFLDQRWKNYFGAAVNSADPTHSKPIIVTEYATGVRTYNGVTFGDEAACNSNQFAQRCYENSLTLVNNRANVLCYWEAANQSWQDSYYGFLRVDSTYRPVYYAFMTLVPFIPDDAMVLTKTWNDAVISAAGFVNAKKIVLGFANSSANTVTRSVQITGNQYFVITNALAFQSGSIVDKMSEVSYDTATHTLNISLPRESTLTVVASLEECAVKTGGDLNADCKVNFEDFAKAASDWMIDNRQHPVNVIENFESYSSTSAMLGYWVPTANVTLTLDSSIVHSGNKAMKYSYDNGLDPWFSKAMFYLSCVDWTNYNTLTIWFKCTVSKEPLMAKVVNCGGENILSSTYGIAQVGDWTKWDIDLSSLTVSQKAQIGRVDIFFTGQNWGAGTTYFDDISVSNPAVTNCAQTIENDVNNDCTVNFEDVRILGINWLDCTLVEQSECWQ
ncbi:MAG: hypothetical protein ABFD79_07435 [Phycisphaerales bacterium]